MNIEHLFSFVYLTHCKEVLKRSTMTYAREIRIDITLNQFKQAKYQHSESVQSNSNNNSKTSRNLIRKMTNKRHTSIQIKWHTFNIANKKKSDLIKSDFKENESCTIRIQYMFEENCYIVMVLSFSGKIVS